MHRIDSISIRNLRGIRQGDLSGLTDVNILIGPNNSGKTTVIEAVGRVARFAGQRSTDLLGRGVNSQPFQRGGEASDKLPQFLWFRGDRRNMVSVEASVAGHPVWLTFTWSEDEQNARMAVGAGRPGPRSGAQVNPDHRAFLDRVLLFLPADAANTGIESTLWERLLADRSDKRVIEAARGIYGLELDQIQLPPDGRVKLLYPDHTVPLDGHGDGTRAGLRLLFAMALLRDGVLAVEEIDAQQHPGSLRRLAGVVCETARKQDIQLILTTHSLECVRALLAAATAAGRDAAVFHLQLDDGELKVVRMDAATAGTLDETGLDVRELGRYA